MHGYSVEGWNSFFLAVGGAAAALTGLVFVALSINLSKILALPGLPGRAGETIVMLTEVLIVGIVALVPQHRVALGIEVLILGGIGWLAPLSFQLREGTRIRSSAPGTGHPDERFYLTRRMALSQVATLPPILAGVSLLIRAGGGLYWAALGIVLLLVNSIANAWVLLVEILR